MKENIKLLLLNAVNHADDISEPILGLGYIAAYIKYHNGKNINVKIIDSLKFEEDVIKFKPDVVGISSVSQNFGIAQKVAKFAKERGVITIIGGMHITSLPSCLDKNMDIGVIGEGEETLLELLTVIKEENHLIPEKLKQIKGIIFWDADKIVFTEQRDLIKDIDSLPFPARDLFKIEGKYISMFSSRGCPYNCIFCASARFWRKIRFHSAEYVVNEIKEVVQKYDARHINFEDDLFVANKSRLRQICELLDKEGLNKKLKFSLSCRANLVDEELVRMLRKMNVKKVFMGLESGNPDILKYAKGGAVTVEQNFKAVNLLNKQGIYTHAAFIIGFPIDTEKTILDTLNFIKKSKLAYCDVYILAPLPGTPIWEYALKKNLVSNTMNWNKMAHQENYDFKTRLLLCENISCEKIAELYSMLKKECRKSRFVHLLKHAVRNPHRLPTYIIKRIKDKCLSICKI